MAEDASTRLSPTEAPAPAEEARDERTGRILRGSTAAPGLVLGRVHRKDEDLGAIPRERIPRERVERELNRFHGALLAARQQLAGLKERLVGRVPVDEARILDTHVAYLKDSVFISDVENLILNEQMTLEASIAKVITDFDRIFRLVRNETLRERAVDLRDVGIRVLRHLEREDAGGAIDADAPNDYVLVARELSIVDMFNLEGEHVLGILTEEGGLTSHAAILARSMRIPTITGIEGLLDEVRAGDFVIVDASEGVVRVDPDELVRAQYRQARSATLIADDEPGAAWHPWSTRDGVELSIGAVCGSLPEVHEAIRFEAPAIGLYRTELLYLVEREPPTQEALTEHYRSVLAACSDRPVTFRLLSADSSLGLDWLFDGREPNPALGRVGIRALFARESVLRTQLASLLIASDDRPLRIAVPLVTDVSDLRRVRETVFELRRELQLTGRRVAGDVEIGPVIETPAAALGVRDLLAESPFALIGLVSLVQYLLASDRSNGDRASMFESPHPILLRVLADCVAAARELERPLGVYGAAPLGPTHVPFVIGLGLRSFSVPPAILREFLDLTAKIDTERARRDAAVVCGHPSAADALPLVDAYRQELSERD